MRRGSALIELPLVVLLLLALAGAAVLAVEVIRHGAVTPRGWVGLAAVAPLAAVVAWLVGVHLRGLRAERGQPAGRDPGGDEP